MNCMSAAEMKIVTQAQALAPDAAAVARQAKLKAAAEKFEGIMLEELLKPMQKAGSVAGSGFDGDESDDSGGDPAMEGMSSYGVEAMAEALAKGGGFGIAKQVLHQIGKQDEKSQEKSSSTKV